MGRIGDERIDLRVAGLGFAVPCLGGLALGVGLHGGHGFGPDVLVVEVFGINPGERFGGQIGEAFGEGIGRFLPRIGHGVFARGMRWAPLGCVGESFFLGGREGGPHACRLAGEHFAEVIVEARGDGPGGVGFGVMAIEPGEVREEQARIEADAVPHRLAAIEDRLARALQRALGQDLLRRIAREHQRRIPPARKGLIAPLVDIGRLRRNPDPRTGAADMAALREVVEEPDLAFGGE